MKPISTREFVREAQTLLARLAGGDNIAYFLIASSPVRDGTDTFRLTGEAMSTSNICREAQYEMVESILDSWDDAEETLDQ